MQGWSKKKGRGGGNVCEHDQEIISPCFINKKHPLSISVFATLFILSPPCDPCYYLVFGHSHPCALIKGDPARRFCALFFVHRGDGALEYWVNIKGAGCEWRLCCSEECIPVRLRCVILHDISIMRGTDIISSVRSPLLFKYLCAQFPERVNYN